jgi:hypothetical protein
MLNLDFEVLERRREGQHDISIYHKTFDCSSMGMKLRLLVTREDSCTNPTVQKLGQLGVTPKEVHLLITTRVQCAGDTDSGESRTRDERMTLAQHVISDGGDMSRRSSGISPRLLQVTK